MVSTIYHVGGYNWGVHIVGRLVIVEKPEDFPHTHFEWEETGVYQMYVYPRQKADETMMCAMHRQIRNFIRHKILGVENKAALDAKKKTSRAKAPQRSRRHRLTK